MSLEVSSRQLSLKIRLLQEDIQMTIKDIPLVCLLVAIVSFFCDQCYYTIIDREHNSEN